MKIDRTHRPWELATAILFTIAALAYIVIAMRSPGGPRGGSAIGLTFGIAGYALMLYAGFLGVRKKIPVVRIGRAQTWMRGHLWLGLLSFPLILFHGGFAWRGPLTAILMLLFFIVILSGIFGAALQHYLPRVMTAQVPMETIYEEIPHVRAQLREEADQLVEATAQIDVEYDDKVRFREMYQSMIRPVLEQPPVELFKPLRFTVPAALHAALDDLENICEEQRQLNSQVRLYRWLHAWLVVHVPLSIALLVLGGVHAVMALRY
ncbi:MAG: hypothetical protein LAO79_11805 [Acidobacteriia bacterium]|nr:hypothetical protein [Terriglobia bacterium]